MLGDVVESALAVGDVRVVTDDPAGRLVAGDLGARLVDDSGDGQGAAVATGLEGASGPLPRRQRRRPCVRPADLIALLAARRRQACDRRARATARRTRSGFRADVFAPLYGPGSAGHFRAHAEALGIHFEELALPNLVDDVDTLADLARLGARAGPRTAALLDADHALKVVCLSGGVGGAKLARGLHDVLAPGELTVIGNVGDDVEVLGLHVSPDLDSVLYALAGLDDEERGWGRAGETWRALETVASSAAKAGSRSATATSGCTSSAPRRCAPESRSPRSRRGSPRRRARAALLPATDDRLRTWLDTPAGPSRSRSGSSRAATATRWTRVRFEGAGTARLRRGRSRRSPPRTRSSSRRATRTSPSIRSSPSTRSARRSRAAACPCRGQPADRRPRRQGPGRPYAPRLAGGTTPAHVAPCYEGLIDVLVDRRGRRAAPSGTCDRSSRRR